MMNNYNNNESLLIFSNTNKNEYYSEVLYETTKNCLF